MIYSDQNLRYCLFKASTEYLDWRDKLADQGFRTISLSMVRTNPNAPAIYTAVMVRLPQPFEGRSSPFLTATELEHKIAEMAAHSPPFHPYIVAALGSGAGVRYAVAFRRSGAATELQPSLSEAQYQIEVTRRRQRDEIPIWIDCFGTETDRRLCVIWAKNLEQVAWNAESVHDKGAVRQERTDAVNSVGGRTSLLAIAPDGGYARVFVDTQLSGSSLSKTAKRLDAFKDEATELAEQGFFPTHIATGVVDGDVVYAALYARSDEILGREFRKHGVIVAGITEAERQKAQKIHEMMNFYLVARRIRCAAVAIVQGTRLVFAHGYNWSEPGSPRTEPTTLFRLASVSKTFCAVAAWKALLDSKQFHRDSNMQAILGIRSPGGLPPKSDAFARITVRNLLENNSGINQLSYRDIMQRLRDSDPPRPAQPVPIHRLLSGVAAEPMEHNPGAQLSYGKTDYVLLGEVARKVAGFATFDEALRSLVLQPLAMTRTRSSRSRIEDKRPDEVLHQVQDMETSPSAVHDDRRIVPQHYGGENYEVFDGAGGISSAVVDVARLCAMFSCRTGNPVLPVPTLKAMLEEAVASERAQGGHAHHGFDNAEGTDPSFAISKGGELAGAGARFRTRTGGISVVVLQSGSVQGGEVQDLEFDIREWARTIRWGDGDLFPDYGMPTLAA